MSVNYLEQEQIDHYFGYDAISQSRLKILLGDPRKFEDMTEEETELYYEEKEHFVIGNAVDCILTQGQLAFNEKYYVSDTVDKKPTAKVLSITRLIYDNLTNYSPDVNLQEVSLTDPIIRDVILDACNTENYYNDWKESTRINKIIEGGHQYFEDLKLSENKQILSTEQKMLVDSIEMSLKTNEHTGIYFKTDIYEHEDVDIYYQYPIYFEIDEIPCKALLDILIVDHKTKRIYPIDVKTIGDNVLNFPKSVRRRRYDIQASFYTEAVKSLSQYADYVVENFMFIVESTKSVGNPILFKCTDEILEIGRWGRPLSIFEIKNIEPTTLVDAYGDLYPVKVHRIEGFMNLLELYKWHSENTFEKEKIVSLNKGELMFDWSGVVY